MMKHLFFPMALLLLTTSGWAQIKTPAPSPGQTIRQDFGLSSIELSYSRPGMKGRKIFGGLVPFGQVWRTGANNATTLNFGEEVIIGGKKIAPGKYGLLSIPDKSEWTLIISKQTDVTSPAAYKPEEDVVRVKAKVMKTPAKAETFTMQFANVKSESCELHIRWDDVMVFLPIRADVDAKVMASIDASMKSEKPAYFQAGYYYLENGKDANKAAEWLTKAAEAQPDAYWVRYQQARAFAKLGKKKEARAAAQKSIELAKAAKNGDYVTLNEKLIANL
jgi:tetratricopeptide (TPR) repeat protein